MATSPIASESSSGPDTKELEGLLPVFLRQATAFQQMGKELENYIKGARGMKAIVEGINRTINSLCDKSLPRFDEFASLLEDQAALWAILEADVQKMGRGFKHFGEQFYMVLKSVELRKQSRKEYAELKDNVEKLQKSFRSRKSEKMHATEKMEAKLADCLDIDRCLVIKIKEIQQGQRKFIADQYTQFMTAQAAFCKDTLQVLNLVPDILKGFLPKKTAHSSKQVEKKLLDLPVLQPPKTKRTSKRI